MCQKRQAATIATHDLKSVKLPLKYDAQFPQLLQVLGIFTIMKYIKISELIHGRELIASMLAKKRSILISTRPVVKTGFNRSLLVD